MKIHDLSPAKGARQTYGRVGRGIGSGWGKTSGRGQKGQSSRSGGSKGNGFEGGQMPITQKIPKRGFKHASRIEYRVINLYDLRRFAAGTQVDPALMVAQGMAAKSERIKILGEGEAPRELRVKAHRFSKSAMKKIAGAGGKTEVMA